VRYDLTRTGSAISNARRQQTPARKSEGFRENSRTQKGSSQRSVRISSNRDHFAVRRKGSLALFLSIRNLLKVVNTIHSTFSILLSRSFNWKQSTGANTRCSRLTKSQLTIETLNAR
jgi:hypothetical protein